MARVHRIGQTRPVHVYRFCTAGTVEERVQLRAEKKLCASFFGASLQCDRCGSSRGDRGPGMPEAGEAAERTMLCWFVWSGRKCQS